MAPVQNGSTADLGIETALLQNNLVQAESLLRQLDSQAKLTNNSQIKAVLFSRAAALLFHRVRKMKSDWFRTAQSAVICLINAIRLYPTSGNEFQRFEAGKLIEKLRQTVKDSKFWAEICAWIQDGDPEGFVVKIIFKNTMTEVNKAESFIWAHCAKVAVRPEFEAETNVDSLFPVVCQYSADSLNKIIWILLQLWEPQKKQFKTDLKLKSLFKDLPVQPNDLTVCSVESFCLLDVEVFLFLCVLIAEKKMAARLTGAPVQTLPAICCEGLVTSWQQTWWSAAYRLSHNSGTSDQRVELQKGLEIIRLRRPKSVEERLVFAVAEMLDSAAEMALNDGDTIMSEAQSAYAKVYWSHLSVILESNKQTNNSATVVSRQESLFFAGYPPWTKQQKDSALDACRRHLEKKEIDAEDSILDPFSVESDNSRLDSSTFTASASFREETSQTDNQPQSHAQHAVGTPKSPFSSELAHSLSVLRSVVQSQDLLVKSVLDQNRNLSQAVQQMSDRLNDLTITNRSLTEEVKIALSAANARDNRSPMTYSVGTMTAAEKPAENVILKQPILNICSPSTVLPLPKTVAAAVPTETFSSSNANTISTSASPFSKFSFSPSGPSLPPSKVSTAPLPSTNLFGQSSTVPPLSFGSLTTTDSANAFKKSAEFKGFGGEGSQLFGGLKTQSSSKEATSPQGAADADDKVEEFEPEVYFAPVIPLPSLVEVKTGEENEEVLFCQRAKLFRFDPTLNEFKERGLGDMKILRHKQTQKTRVVMRREQVLKLCANHAITPGMELKPMQKSDKAYTWACQDYSEEVLTPETLAVRFKTPQMAEEFKKIFVQCVTEASNTKTASPLKTLPQSSGFGDAFKVPAGSWSCPGCYARNDADKSVCVCCGTGKDGQPAKSTLLPAPTTTASTFSFGFGSAGSTVTPTPSFGFGQTVTKPSPAAVAPPTTNLFGFGQSPSAAPLTFGSSNVPQKPIDFKGFGGFKAQSPVAAAPTSPDVQADHDDKVEEFEPEVNFTPVIPLPSLVEVKTGEENEEVLFCHRAKLFRFDPGLGEFKERGIGDFKILRHKQTGKSRVVMRREQVLKLCANHVITSGMELKPMQKSDKAYVWACQDFSEEVVTPETLAVRFKTSEVAEEFKKFFTQCVKEAESSGSPQKSSGTIATPTEVVTPVGFGDKFKLPAGAWNCVGCYAQNESNKTVCVCCGGGKDGQPAKPTLLPTATVPASTFSSFSFGLSSTTKPAPVVTTAPLFGASTAAPPATSLFGNSVLFGQTSAVPPLTFGSLTTAESANVFKKPADFKGFGGEGSQLFGGLKTTMAAPTSPNADHDDKVEEFEPEVNFTPVIPLPSLVEVKTGEENEEVLFCQRAKLFRFDPTLNEFKERGLGDMKILRHKQTQKTRVVMRREQVLKLCANHAITPGMELKPMQKSDKAYTWACQDYSEEVLTPETLAVRFKTPQMAEEFKKVFVRCVTEASGSSPVKATVTKPAVTEPTGFGNMFKLPTGSWNCPGCYAQNDASQSACVCCSTGRDGQVAKPALLPTPATTASTFSTFSFGFSSGSLTTPSNASLDPTGGDEPVIIYAVTPTQEQIEKARKYQLPDTFYLYENRPGCPGCPGCQEETSSAGSSDSANSEEMTVVLEKRASLLVKDTTDQYEEKGGGIVRIGHEKSLDGYHLFFYSDDQKEEVMNHMIAKQYSVKVVLGKNRSHADWEAVDFVGLPRRKQFRLIFSSPESCREFRDAFEKGRELAEVGDLNELNHEGNSGRSEE